MKKTNIYILAFLVALISSCANDDMMSVVDDASVPDIEIMQPEKIDGVYATIPELIDGNAANGEVASRSSLHYDRLTNTMKFSWINGSDAANMGVFSPNQNNNTVSAINFTKKDKTTLSGTFEPDDPSIDPLTGNTSYIAFRPFEKNSPQFNYHERVITFNGQTNGNNVKLGQYYKANYTSNITTEQKNTALAAYDASEILAANHLGAIDYLVSEPRTTSEEASVYFPLLRVGVIARFFIKNPTKEVFEKLQLVTQGAPNFVRKGTIDLSTRQITATESSNVMELQYGENGIDMSVENEDYYYTYNGTKSGYMVSYMMLAPIDLSGATSVNLYLVSHPKDNASTKHYYKSDNLSKPTLTSNMFYQWRPNGVTSPDTPITFTEVTFQQWKNGIAISNGESGSGTEGW